ncbi:MAG TPA: NAD-dependent epimerase/dehydratase family protein [Saprospiraceae bacterium]|nr:NAD-dependent epimerase/dehydratase family protein [Saprospiraceae bacterium]HMP24798.1 NAD-dependent epimerase/dehydratase family protein [Saprospiraceae bacterium]
MQTIIGANGAIGTPLAKELRHYTDRVRLVSRNPKAVHPDDELLAANLLDFKDIDRAVAGSEVVYITIGFAYNIHEWRKVWPPFIQQMIEACERHNAKMVFFDNVYMYDIKAIPHMTEDAPMHPPSKKGTVRKQLVEMIFEAVEAGRIQALIARGADFYGPGNTTSFLIETIAKPLKQGKRVTILGAADKKHSYTYTPDAAKATAILGNTPDAYNQIWHMPTHPDTLTQREWLELFAREMGIAVPKYSVLPKWMLGMLGIFVPFMREVHEMIYQFDRDYFLDSSKFEQRFNFQPTDYQTGARATVQAL